jgi:hypothetical protein
MIISICHAFFLAGVALLFHHAAKCIAFLLGFIGVETTPRLSNYFSFTPACFSGWGSVLKHRLLYSFLPVKRHPAKRSGKTMADCSCGGCHYCCCLSHPHRSHQYGVDDAAAARSVCLSILLAWFRHPKTIRAKRVIINP